MGRTPYLIISALCLFLLGCGSSKEEVVEPVLPPEVVMEEEPALREFQFGVGDEIDIVVWRQEDFSQKVTVNPDGYISFDLLGAIKVANRSYDEFYDELAGRISRYVREPRIAINVIKVTDEKIYVMGWVRYPGVYIWNSQMNVVEAIATAGDIVKDVGGPRSVLIVSGDAENPELRVIDYLSIVRDGNLKDNIRLQRGDIVYVPKQFMAHVDKFFQRYGSYFRAIREGMWAIDQYPGVVDAASGDRTKRLRILTHRMQD